MDGEVTVSEDLQNLIGKVATIDNPGRLTEDDPMIVRPYKFFTRYEAATARIRVWVEEQGVDDTILCFTYPAISFRDGRVDLDQFSVITSEKNGDWLFSRPVVRKRVEGDVTWVDVSAQYALPGLAADDKMIRKIIGQLSHYRNRYVKILCDLEREAKARDRKESEDLADKNDALEQLDELVGLRNVKAFAHRLAAQQEISELRREAGLRVTERSPHLVFTGNPGTGKTTVAGLIGQLYKGLGLLTSGHVVVADRSTLVAPYLGQTALRTKEVCESALGGVLFIDEAYGLVVEGRDYGTEVIETLLTFMETHRNQMAVVVAGYPKEMRSFIGSNPGLGSRFDVFVDFPDYSSAELLTIFENMLDEHDYELEDEARDLVGSFFERMPRGRGFGNAREARRLFDAVVCAHALTLIETRNPTRDQLRTLTADAIRRVGPEKSDSADGQANVVESWNGYL